MHITLIMIIPCPLSYRIGYTLNPHAQGAQASYLPSLLMLNTRGSTNLTNIETLNTIIPYVRGSTLRGNAGS